LTGECRRVYEGILTTEDVNIFSPQRTRGTRRKSRNLPTTEDTEGHRGSQNPHPLAENARRVGHPLFLLFILFSSSLISCAVISWGGLRFGGQVVADAADGVALGGVEG
jgi:hypothetical protein